MAAIPEPVFAGAISLVTQYFATAIRQGTPPELVGVTRGESVTTIPGELGAAPAGGEGCPVCALHRELAEAKGLTEGMAMRASSYGGVPPRLGGTLLLVRQNLLEAAQKLARVRAEAPQLARQCDTLTSRLASAEARLPTERGGVDECRRAHQAMQEAWQAAYNLSCDYFGVPHRQEQDRLQEWYELARSGKWDAQTAASNLRRIQDGAPR